MHITKIDPKVIDV